jgi:hypothetical protein
MEKQECARKSCDNEGILSFRVRPDLKYCRGCFEYLALKVRRINGEMRRIRTEQRNENEDNRPARQPSGY